MRLERLVLRSIRAHLRPATSWMLLVYMVASGPCCLLNSCAFAKAAIEDRAVDTTTRLRVVEELIVQLRRRYVLPEAVGKIETRLRAKLSGGAYDGATTGPGLASLLTEDLRAAGDDLHFDVSYDPTRERDLARAGASTRSKLPELPLTKRELELLRASNYGFRRVEVLLGNIGYLELTSFVDLKHSREAAIAAMSFIANSDAVIIDLRRNHGGSGNLVDFVVSYFFGPRPVELMSHYDRETNTTSRHRTLRAVPGKRLTQADLYILTSRETGSAAEAFAFTLQQVDRAKTIGDRTVGAAHGGGWVPLGNGFVAFVPTFRVFNPRTGKSWNSTGVQPDIPTPADKALEMSHLEAVKRLLAKAAADYRKRELGWILPLLHLRALGEKVVQPSTLDDYVGSYEGITVSMDEGRLYFLGASGIRRRLLAIGDDLFLIEDTTVPAENQAHVRFVKTDVGGVSELQLIVNDGRVFRRPRK